MTSSLVGSEMCIRDSLISSNGAAIAPVAAQLSNRAVCVEVLGDSVPRKRNCLLYTSDAADDM
eukprot:12748507-Prorocentrum_lima.AAC.1